MATSEGFPGESAAYRTARDQLLEAEIALRRQIERVAALRRALPLGGRVPRHVDLLWPLWNLLDLTPEGRGTDWYPSLRYDR